MWLKLILGHLKNSSWTFTLAIQVIGFFVCIFTKKNCQRAFFREIIIIFLNSRVLQLLYFSLDDTISMDDWSFGLEKLKLQGAACINNELKISKVKTREIDFQNKNKQKFVKLKFQFIF